MLLGLIAAGLASLAYGVGSVLQAMAASGTGPPGQQGRPSLVRIVLAWRYMCGLALDGVGFLVTLVALHYLPLFAVQAVVASSLAVAALVGALVTRVRLAHREGLAVAAVIVGLTLVGLSSAPQSHALTSSPTQWWIVLVAIAVAVPTAGSWRRSAARGGAVLMGSIAGLAFGVTAIAIRLLESDLAEHGLRIGLLLSPSALALVVAVPLALTSYAAALQRGSVVSAMAPMTVCETLLPALWGVALLHDHARAGWAVPAFLGFALAVLGATALTRVGGEMTGPGPRSAADVVTIRAPAASDPH